MYTVCGVVRPESSRVLISIMPHGADTDSLSSHSVAVTGGQCVKFLDSWIVV